MISPLIVTWWEPYIPHAASSSSNPVQYVLRCIMARVSPRTMMANRSLSSVTRISIWTSAACDHAFMSSQHPASFVQKVCITPFPSHAFVRHVHEAVMQDEHRGEGWLPFSLSNGPRIRLSLPRKKVIMAPILIGNWSPISLTKTDIQAVKRLLELFRHEPIVVWIDEIDGLPPVLARRVLEDFLRRTEGHRVKLLLTCKSETWQYLLKEDGIPTMLMSRVFQVNDERGYQVGPLEEQEMLATIMKYRAFYHYTGKLDIEVLEMCQRVPFLLRVLFEVAVSLSL